jgi:hypothetical protein
MTKSNKMILLLLLTLNVSTRGEPNFVGTKEPNMNGEYPLSVTPGGTAGLFPRAFKDYPGGVEYFDVYSPPMKTLYSQVWWSPLEPTSLPTDIINKYKNKGMAIVGWEIDQVRRVKDKNGTLIDESVPISASYNHHYVARLIGSKSKFKKVENVSPNSVLGKKIILESSHGMVNWDQPQYIIEDIEKSQLNVPTKQYFSSANGGEYRKTFHGFPPSYVLVVDSPTSIQITPMQIDTWNRDKMNISTGGKDGGKPIKFVPGPMPKAALSPKDAEYSGLLECPMTTRISKVIDGKYIVQSNGSCKVPILTYQECFHAAATLLSSSSSSTKYNFNNQTINDTTSPSGCAVYIPSTSSSSSSSSSNINIVFNKNMKSNITCANHVNTVFGQIDALFHMDITINNTSVIITLKGPSSVWFGVGFNAHGMIDEPWTIIVNGKTGSVSERKLGNHAAGNLLNTTLNVISNELLNDTRKVVVTRSLKGKNDNYYTFSRSTNDATIPIIMAIGSSSKFGYHKEKVPTSITLLPQDSSNNSSSRRSSGSCICPQEPKPFGEATGSLVYHATNQTADIGQGAVGFNSNKCKKWPSTNIMNQTNPTCDIRHYRGGQWSCHHMWSLLDADQTIPWVDQPLIFSHKYRFWVM